VLPPQTPVYEDDRVRAKKLQGRRGYAPVDCQLIEGYQTPIGYAPPKEQLAVWGDEYFPTTLFLHGVRVGSEERLVLVDAHINSNYPPEEGRTLVLWLRNKPFATSLKHSLLWDDSSSDFRLAGTDVLRIFAGGIDPNNPAVFRIPYELNGQPGVIEGSSRPPDGLRLRVVSGGLVPYQGTVGIP
jgi:hypothetical protein